MPIKRERIPHVDDPLAVGKRLVGAREAQGLSQRELSFPGCSAAYISRIERGERVPSLQVLRELARRTGVSEAQLAYGKERVHPDVARTLRQVEEAAGAANSSERAPAYAAVGRRAS